MTFYLASREAILGMAEAKLKLLTNGFHSSLPSTSTYVTVLIVWQQQHLPLGKSTNKEEWRFITISMEPIL